MSRLSLLAERLKGDGSRLLQVLPIALLLLLSFVSATTQAQLRRFPEIKTMCLWAFADAFLEDVPAPRIPMAIQVKLPLFLPSYLPNVTGELSALVARSRHMFVGSLRF